MLIEVLVSMLISALAELALASVHAASMRYSKMSQHRALATHLALDIGERMRANKGSAATLDGAEGFLAGAYDYAVSFAGQADDVAPAPQTCSTLASVCSRAQLAQADMAQWRQLVRRQLPQGSVFVLRQPAVDAADVWIAWRDPLVLAADEAPVLAAPCPAGLQAGSTPGLRCAYFRINL